MATDEDIYNKIYFEKVHDGTLTKNMALRMIAEARKATAKEILFNKMRKVKHELDDDTLIVQYVLSEKDYNELVKIYGAE